MNSALMEGEDLENGDDDGGIRFRGDVYGWWKDNLVFMWFGELNSEWLPPWLGDSEHDDRSEPRIGVEVLLISIILMEYFLGRFGEMVRNQNLKERQGA